MEDTKSFGELSLEEQVKVWRARVELAQRYQDKHGNTDKRWDKNVKALAGDFNSEDEIGVGAVDVHMMRSSIRTSLPPLYITEPHISVRATTEKYKGQDNVQRAENTEVEINYWFGELKVRRQIKKILVDGETTDHGYAYLGYVKDKSELEVDGHRTENEPTIRHRQPFIKRVSPKNVLVPPGYEDLEEAPWVDIIFLKPYGYVRKKWPKTTEDLQPTVNYQNVGKEAQDTEGFTDYLDSKDSQLVEVHNIWDKESNKVYILARDHDKYLEDPKEWPYEVEGFPLVHYRPEYIPDEYNGTPPMSYSLTQNKELNITRTAMSKRRKKTKSVIWMDAEIAREAKEAYAKAEDGEIIPLQLNDKPINQSMVVDNGLAFDTGDLAYDAVVKADIHVSDGLSQEQRGSADPNVDSATASANIEKHAQVRQSDKGDVVRDLYLDIARKLWMILKQFPDTKVRRRILGPRRDQYREVEYTLRELRGEFAFEMDFSAMLADNPSTRMMTALANYNMFRADPLVNPEALLLDVYKAQNKPNPENYLVFLRDPDQEFQMFMQGLPVEAHERDDHMEHIQAHSTQGDQLVMAMRQVQQAGKPTEKIQMGLALIQAHVNDHMMKLQKMQGGESRPPGQPVAENMLRNQMKVSSGNETQAEMTGQPLKPEDTVQ